MSDDNGFPIVILLVEDNPGDVKLTEIALKEGKLLNRMIVAYDGEEAMEFLHRRGRFADAPQPDLILLDLNLPRKSGHEVLKELKADDRLKHIPVVVLTTSKAEEDIIRSYTNHANCYITKPVDLHQFIRVVKSIQDFWVTIVTLPKSRETH
jgi:two-component system, chemotaxis family, response regulator Rcp1